MSKPILTGKAGETHLLLGNEAIVRGALEAGIDVVSCYPGTPSSEVPDTFFALSGAQGGDDYYFEYSVNEKVALEVGGGATLAGAMTLVTMKHVGVNVAADPLMTLAYIGTPGGLVLLSADDPGCHSSQNEQDNRYYARLAGLPCFEPATAQEAKDMVREALLLSRQWQQPVLLRTTTRLNHLRGPVAFGERAAKQTPAGFQKNPRRFVPIPAVARARHGELLKKLAEAAETSESTSWNRVHGEGKVGVVASGISRAYLADALQDPALTGKVRVFELGMSWPLPEKRLLSFMSGLQTLLVLEEGEPILENEIRALVQRSGKAFNSLDIRGKGTAGLSRMGEYATGLVRRALAEVLGVNLPEGLTGSPTCAVPENLPQRPPNLCAGCPHRATYFAVRKIFGDNAVYSSDIGCYTLGILPPLSAADFLLCMGSSISAGSGVSKASGQTTIAFIGDSTFYHSGITGLVNAVFNKHDILVVIVDNRTTAMTGHQPNPGVDVTIQGACDSQVDIEAIVRGCGVCNVQTVNPLKLKAFNQALEEMKAASGVRVLIAREACPLHARRLEGRKVTRVAYVAQQGEDVLACLETLACPAFSLVGGAGGEVRIDEDQCSGCMVCLQMAPGIKAKGRGE
ncbi:indolepyruvate ferredoxin oxidoreductase subunit alpha [Desulfocurvibacter africanus]|uniref:Indolepyruvate oxidoreductase subunit IorA n=1 Tax=Desulfocurvibacter africanus subsp. africanus str. Walvis Bay TaxID=690850 RepID=F3YV88_DESAF|nr:indolepyruvate ferredoxin oxidoreductase subunit alpha [Desulfocurvibacter africanus]EGJ48406.1 indolepyruvate ferredoxin oxidoreductase, alpha subunit [Desulfocurvibacter africanus subsp. africanus str. Walvis Bay]